VDRVKKTIKQVSFFKDFSALLIHFVYSLFYCGTQYMIPVLPPHISHCKRVWLTVSLSKPLLAKDVLLVRKWGHSTMLPNNISCADYATAILSYNIWCRCWEPSKQHRHQCYKRIPHIRFLANFYFISSSVWTCIKKLIQSSSRVFIKFIYHPKTVCNITRVCYQLPGS
jgi:hypothetical protein